MRLESYESDRPARKVKKIRVNGFGLEYTAKKKSGKVVKPVLTVDSPDSTIPPMKLNPELASSLKEMLEDYLEAVKAAEWHDGYRIHADWEDRIPRNIEFFDDDDDW